MTEKEAKTIIERLKSGCAYHRFEEPGVYAEYVRALMKYNYKPMNEAVDAILEDDSWNVPPISELAKAYKSLTQENKPGAIVPHNEQYCEVCDDKGFVLMTETHKNGNIDLSYQYVLYCPYCAVGQSQAYDGSKCKEKSPYKCEPLTKYFDEQAIDEMRRKNRERKDIRDEREGMRLENVTANIGRRI